MAAMKKIVLFMFMTIITLAGAQNECFDTSEDLGDLAKRSPNYYMDAVPVCDKYLVKGWYFALGHEMSTTPPLLTACGTTYPYWLNDDLPETQGTRKAVKVCEVGFDSECSRSHYIQVTNCGTFFVYELTPIDRCPSAYCFQQNKGSCVADVPINVVVAYHGVTWKTSIKGEHTVVTSTKHDPDVNLVCKFDRLPDETLFYDVTWYVDDTEVLTNQTVSSNSSDLALLTGSQMWVKRKKANSMIHCIVGAKISANDSPCKTVASSLFYAGIKVLNTTLTIPRGSHQDVKLQFTIPFVNENIITKNPKRTSNDQTPLDINLEVHNGTVDCHDPNRETCEKQLFAYKWRERDRYATDDWKVIHNIRVYNRDDGDFTLIDKHITLRLKTTTISAGGNIFENLILPDIQVYIEDTDSSWKGAYCESHTDPHMKTFDRKYYECQLDGTFILYRNDHFKQEVQEKHHICHPSHSYPRCTCAVAVRSGKDVFIVDICNSKSIIHFPSCGDKVMKVIKQNDRYYKIILPTGTLVEIKFVSWPTQNDLQLNIDIYPSPSDVGKSSGLCGILDGNYRNDFRRKDGIVDNPDLYHYHNPPDEFSDSWRVKDNELDLFDDNSYNNLMSISGVLDRVCTCDKTGTIDCTYGTYKNCKFVVGKKFHCILNPEGQLRRKRDVRHLEKISSSSQNQYVSMERQKRETAPSTKTYEEAEIICSTAFQASTSYKTCQEYVTDLSNTSLVNCISDVMMTGDENFTRIHIEAALEQCSVFVVLNTTFQQTEPEVAYTIETFCQNNCSGHGICNAGNCTCNEGYAGSDCSFDLLGPPTISHISDFGFCDKSHETCEEINLFGKYFVENMNTNCFIKRHTLKEDGTSLSVVDYVVSLEERTLFEGFCSLEYEQVNHWVTEFSFNISNDGSRFTENFYVYTYQSLCQEYRNDTGNITFIFKDGYCFINNSCEANGSTNTNNKCDICITSKSKYDWSYNEGHCLISGVCYESGDIEGTNPCSICDPSLNTTAWSANTNLCFIDGLCYSAGQTRLEKDCHVCQPNSSITDWTLKKDHCLINEVCFMNGQSNESNPCQLCNTSQSKDSWTENPDFCFINDTCYGDGQTHIEKDCLICQPNLTRTNWTLKKDQCLINELCFMDSKFNESNPCQLCNTSQSKDSWIENPAFCSINDTCYNDSQPQVGKDCLVCQPNSTRTNWTLKKDHCLINELCFMNGQSNEYNPCQLCITPQSNDSWTEHQDFCFINGTCYNDSQPQLGNDCLVCQPNSTRTNWTLKNDHCLINDLCFMNSQSNESNLCQLCNTSQSKDSWTENPAFCSVNGTCYNESQTQVGKDCFVCHPNLTRSNWTLKKDHCLINELCFISGQSNESNPCQLCNTSKSKDSWTENPDFCFINGVCYSDGQTQVGKDCQVCQPNSRAKWTLKNDHCLINELCFMNGQSNESNPCQLCNTSQSKDSWTKNPDFCSINGVCYSDGQTEVDKDCLVCQPNLTRSNWTLKKDHCLINELCFMNDQSNESNPCQHCNTSQSKDSWTKNPDFCSINGTCYSDGQTNEGTDCLFCQPNSTRTKWTLTNDHCLINELCFMNGQSNDSNPCQLCNTSQSKDFWTENPDSCIINGTCYSNGQRQFGKDCLVCQPNSTRNTWTLKTEYCLINELCFMNGQSNESNPCQHCNASQSKDSWTENPDFCSINSTCYSASQTQGGKECLVCQLNSSRTKWSLKNDHCLINELCFRNGQFNESNRCQLCNASQSKDSWTENPDFCLINGTCFGDGQTQVEQSCLVCQPNSTRTTWTLKNDHCLINELCFMNGQSNKSNPCQHCNTSKSKDSWTENPDHCLISKFCFMNGQSNESNPCQMCNASQSKDSWTENPDFCFINGTCYSDGQTQVGKDCLVCQPNFTRKNWTLKNDYCLINELCFMDNQSNESNPCQLCNASQCKDSWTENPDCSNMTSNEPSTASSSEPSTTTPEPTIPTQEPTTTTQKPTTTTPEPTTTTPEPTTTTPEPTTTTTEPTTTTPEPTTTTPEPTTTTPVLTTTTQKPTTTTPEPTTTTPEPTTTTPEHTTTTPEPTTTTTEPNTTTPEPTTTTPEPTTTTPEPTTTTPEPTTTTPEPTTTTPKPTTTTPEPTITTTVPTTTTPEPTTTTPEPTTSTPEPTTTTPEPTTTTPEPTTTTPEPTTTTPEPTTTTPEPTTTTPEPTTSTPKPTTATQEPTTTTQTPTTSTPQPPTTTQEPPTTTQEPSTTTTEPTATTQEPTTTTQEPTNTTPESTTTPQEPTTTTPEPTTTPQEPTTTTSVPTTTTPEPTTSTPEPTTTTPEPTTTTEEPTTTTQQPTTTTPLPTIITQELTTATPEPTTSPEHTTTTQEPSTTTSEPITITPVPLTTEQPNCMKSPKDVSVEYQSVSWFSTNETNTTTIRTMHQPYINFKCMFVLRQDASLFYKIEWYVNNATLIKTVTVSEADIGQATLSSNGLPPLDNTAGLQIQCTVSVSKDLAPANCERKTSPVFFAGIKVNQAYHDLLRKGKTSVMMYMTIPYVTKTVVVNGQVQPLPALAIYPLLPQSSSSCRGTIGVDKCVIEFKAFSFNERQKYDSHDWRQNQTLVLNHVDTNGYEIDQSMKIQLKTRSDGNTFWNNFNQNISMTITDYNEYWKGRSCGSKTDPHMYTFDGVSYENHIEGEFILYRNMLYNQEVQTRHKQCHPDYNFPHCTCAVYVQSGQDVFLVDLCGDVQFVDFLSCNDSVIQVYKRSDKLYKISLPTGTYVMVSLVEWPVQGSWQIDIDIYPSLSDVNNTVGLCGTLDGDRDNDFRRRSGDTDNVNFVYPDGFSNSWKVLDDGNLLKEPLSTRQPISSILDKICMCTSNGDQCSYNTLTHCSTTVEKQFLCTELTVQTSVSRKKRDLSGKWIPPSLSVPKPLTRNKRDVQFNISTSRENAEAVCTSAFESSDPYRTCQEYVSDLSNSSLSNCINDVIMTGDYNITAIHVEAALQQCVTFVSSNTTLQNANPVVTTSIQSLCPSNCSGHGVCNKGNCSCAVGFGGSDCSFDILSPPVIWESTPSGICDKSLQQCSRVYLKGRYFLENVDKNCFFDKQSIRHDGSILAFTQLESSLEEENLFRGSCSIPSDDVTSWVTKYMFNVSYDRKQFTQSYSFYAYQSECQQHSVENGQDHFTLKKEYCFINNTCVQLAAVNPENRCQECNPGRNNYQWSGIQDCESTTTLKPSALSTSTVVYIVTALVLVFLFVVAIVVVIGVWKHRRSRQYAESSEDENTDYRRDVVSKSWMRFFDDGKFPYIPRGSRYSAETYSSSKTERFY